MLNLGARWYDPALGRFLSADSIVPEPGNPQDLNRFTYARGNPLRYTDSTGHFSEDEIFTILGANSWDEVYAQFADGAKYAGMWGLLDTLRLANDGDRLTAIMGSRVEEWSPGRWKTTYDKESLGTARLKDGKLLFDQNGTVTPGLPILTSGKYDRLEIESDFLGSTMFRPVHLYTSETMQTKRFDPSKLDKFNLSMDAAGLGLSIFGASAPAQAARAAENAQRLSYGIGGITIGKALAVVPPDLAGAGLSFLGALPYPMISIPASSVALLRDLSGGIQP